MHEKYLIPLSIFLSSIVLAVGIYFVIPRQQNNNEITKNNSNQEKQIDKIKKVDPKTDHILGSRDADIYIIEYSDLECPGCKAFHKIEKDLIKKYENNKRVGFVYRHFPLYKSIKGKDPLHPTAGVEAMATECAAKLGGENKFFEMLNKIFNSTKSTGTYPVENLSTLAQEINLDEEKFAACMQSEEIKNKIAQDWEDAKNADILGTPSIYIKIKASDKSFEIKPGKKILENVIDSYLENN